MDPKRVSLLGDLPGEMLFPLRVTCIQGRGVNLRSSVHYPTKDRIADFLNRHEVHTSKYGASSSYNSNPNIRRTNVGIRNIVCSVIPDDAVEILHVVLTIPKLPRRSIGGLVGAGESGIPNTAFLLKAPGLTPKHLRADIMVAAHALASKLISPSNTWRNILGLADNKCLTSP